MDIGEKSETLSNTVDVFFILSVNVWSICYQSSSSMVCSSVSHWIHVWWFTEGTKWLLYLSWSDWTIRVVCSCVQGQNQEFVRGGGGGTIQKFSQNEEEKKDNLIKKEHFEVLYLVFFTWVLKGGVCGWTPFPSLKSDSGCAPSSVFAILQYLKWTRRIPCNYGIYVIDHLGSFLTEKFDFIYMYQTPFYPDGTGMLYQSDGRIRFWIRIDW